MIEHIRLALDGSKVTVGLVAFGAVLLAPPVMVIHDMLQKLPGATPETSAYIVSLAMFDLIPWALIVLMAAMMLSVMRRI